MHHVASVRLRPPVSFRPGWSLELGPAALGNMVPPCAIHHIAVVKIFVFCPPKEVPGLRSSINDIKTFPNLFINQRRRFPRMFGMWIGYVCRFPTNSCSDMEQILLLVPMYFLTLINPVFSGVRRVAVTIDPDMQTIQKILWQETPAYDRAERVAYIPW